MSVAELIRLMENKLSALNNAKATAGAVGDITQVNAIEIQILDTQMTLDQLRTLG